jgi:hypothetical protein
LTAFPAAVAPEGTLNFPFREGGPTPTSLES